MYRIRAFSTSLALLFIHVSDKNGKYEITEEYEI